MILLTCDQSPLDMVRRRWPLGTPGTPAPAPPRPQGLDETLSAQRRCPQNDRQSESSLGLSLAMIVPSCAASGVETPTPQAPARRVMLRPCPRSKHSSNAEPSPSPTPRARAHQARPGTQRHMRSQQCPCSAPAPAPRRTRRSCLTERQRLVSLILQPT